MPRLLAGGGQVAGDLHAQLTGRDDDQRLRHAVAALVDRDDALQHRDAEAEGLAGAGAGLTDQVVAGQRERERQLLDRERAGDPDLGQGRDDVGVDVEVAEQRAVGGDGRAAELLDLRLDLLGSGRAGLGVVELGSCGGDVRGVLGGGQCSRLWSAGGGARCARRSGPVPVVVAGSVSSANSSQQNRASGDRPGRQPDRGVVQRSSAHRYTARPRARRFPS